MAKNLRDMFGKLWGKEGGPAESLPEATATRPDEPLAFPETSRDPLVYWAAEAGEASVPWGTEVTVAEGERAVFFRNGEVVAAFGPGRHRLRVEAIPFLAEAFERHGEVPESPYRSEIFFFDLEASRTVGWGTAEGIVLEDATFGLVELNYKGRIAFRIEEPERFLREVVGVRERYPDALLLDAINGAVSARLLNLVRERVKDVRRLEDRIEEISRAGRDALRPELAAMGVALGEFAILSLDLPEAVREKVAAERTRASKAASGKGGAPVPESANANEASATASGAKPGRTEDVAPASAPSPSPTTPKGKGGEEAGASETTATKVKGTPPTVRLEVESTRRRDPKRESREATREERTVAMAAKDAEMDAGRETTENVNVLLTGPVGAGKTALLASLDHTALMTWDNPNARFRVTLFPTLEDGAAAPESGGGDLVHGRIDHLASECRLILESGRLPLKASERIVEYRFELELQYYDIEMKGPRAKRARFTFLDGPGAALMPDNPQFGGGATDKAAMATYREVLISRLRQCQGLILCVDATDDQKAESLFRFLPDILRDAGPRNPTLQKVVICLTKADKYFSRHGNEALNMAQKENPFDRAQELITRAGLNAFKTYCHPDTDIGFIWTSAYGFVESDGPNHGLANYRSDLKATPSNAPAPAPVVADADEEDEGEDDAGKDGTNGKGGKGKGRNETRKNEKAAPSTPSVDPVAANKGTGGLLIFGDGVSTPQVIDNWRPFHVLEPLVFMATGSSDGISFLRG